MTDDVTRDDLEALLALQAAESSLRTLRHRLDALPEQAALEATLASTEEVRAERDARRVDLDMVDAQMRKLEGEIALFQERLADEQQRMYGGDISNPRELQALRSEVENVERRIADLEDDLLEAMERKEQLGSEIEGLESRLEDLAADRERLTVERDDAAQDLLAEIAETEVERDAQRARVPGAILERYETAKARHGGIGVGALADGFCTACRLQLTPLEISDLREGPPVGTCPQCQRLLVEIE